MFYKLLPVKGKEKETKVTSYTAISIRTVNYAASTNCGLTYKNIALRIASGSHQMTDMDHLHVQTKILYVRAYNLLLS